MSDIQRISVGRDQEGRTVIDVTGTAKMQMSEAQAWLLAQVARARRESASGASAFSVSATVRFVCEDSHEAERIADDLRMYADDLGNNGEPVRHFMESN